jgi:thiol-disulfide isomerase/thioredoxin
MRYFLFVIFLGVGYTAVSQKAGFQVHDTIFRLPPIYAIRADGSVIDSFSLTAKPTILDMGNLSCPSCIEELPRMDRLQAEFTSQIQICWAVTNTRAEMIDFLQHNKYGKRLKNITLIPDDSVIEQAFHHIYIPYFIWLGANGIVTSFTDPNYVDSLHIAELVMNLPHEWPSENQFYFPEGKSLLASTGAPSGAQSAYNRPSYMVLAPRLPSYVRSNERKIIDSARNFVTYQYINLPVMDMYFFQISEDLPHWYNFEPGYYRFATKRNSDLVCDPKKEYRLDWEQRNTYCYERRFDLRTPVAERRRQILSDLDYFFRFRTGFENRETACYVLKKLPSFGSSLQLIKLAAKKTVFTAGMLVSRFEESNNSYPFFDETGLPIGETDAIPISFNQDKGNYSLSKVNASLAKVGLTIVSEKKVIKIFAVYDR